MRSFKTTIGEIIDNPEIVFVDKQSIIEWALRNLKVILEEAESLGRMTRTDLFVTMAIIGKMPSLTLLSSQALVMYSQQTVIPAMLLYNSHFSITKIAQAVENSMSGVLAPTSQYSIFLLIGYWCSLSAQFELWLTQDRLCANITLFLLELFVPSYFELAIYGKIKSDVVGGKIDATVLCIFIGINQIADVTMGDESRAHRHSVFD
ncbi:hypothetical protein GQX74_004110 [Glossina fuscipes]|nr:hypothetical protein GQX74_004110 [Glossina fuscipes]